MGTSGPQQLRAWSQATTEFAAFAEQKQPNAITPGAPPLPSMQDHSLLGLQAKARGAQVGLRYHLNWAKLNGLHHFRQAIPSTHRSLRMCRMRLMLLARCLRESPAPTGPCSNPSPSTSRRARPLMRLA